MMCRIGSVILAGLGLAACTPNIGLNLNASTPPVILAPTPDAQAMDLRGRFREIFCAITDDHGASFPDHRPCGDALHRLEREGRPTGQPLPPPPAAKRRILIVPGIFGECVDNIATPFEDAAGYLRGQGYVIDVIPVSGRSSSAENAVTIRDWIAQFVRPGERLLIVGYSKGTSDILETLGAYPRSIPPGSAIVSIAGVVAGTPIADRWEALYAGVGWMPLPGCGPGDRRGVASLTRRHRLAWLAANPLPRDRSYYSLAAYADRRAISRMLRPFNRQLSTIDGRNDGQLLIQDAVVPGGYLLGYANADHWAVALPLARNRSLLGRLSRPFASRNAYPREVLLEAIVRIIEERDQAD